MIILFLVAESWAAMVTKSPLAKALRSTRTPLIVHLWDPNPTALEAMAIDDVSEACREAGAVAVLVDASLVSAVAKEQEASRGNFPGPLPVIVDCSLSDLAEAPEEVFQGAKNLGLHARAPALEPALYSLISLLSSCDTCFHPPCAWTVPGLRQVPPLLASATI